MPTPEQRDRAVIEHLPDPVLIVDVGGRLSWAGAAAARFGLDPSRTGDRAFAHLHAADFERAQQALAAALDRPGEAITIDGLRVPDATGAFVRFNVDMRYLPDSPGIQGVLITAREAGDARQMLPDDEGGAMSLREERLRQVIRLSGIGLFDHDHRTGQVYWSAEQRKIYGWGPEEPVDFGSEDSPASNSNTWEVLHPEDRDRVAAAIKRAHSGPEDAFDIEYRILRRDGSQRWVATRSRTFFTGEGSARRPVRTIGAVQDITDRKRAERQLRFTQASVDRSNTAIFWVSAAGQVTYANSHACETLGRTSEELVGLHVWDFDPEYTAERWRKALANLRRRHTLVGRSQQTRKDGTRFPVETIANYLIFDGEEHVFVFAQDMTERQRAERQLQLLNAAIENSRTPFFAGDGAGKIVYANENACESLGLTREELIGRHLWDFNPQVSPQIYDGLWELLKSQKMVIMESRHRHKDGTLIPVEVTSNYFSFKGEEYSVTFAQDISERRKTDLALRQTRERLEQVVAVYDIGIFDHDLVSNTLYWSPELRRVWNLETDAPARIDKFRDAILPEDRKLADAAVTRAHDPRGDGRFDVQMRVVRADGQLRWMDARSQTFFEGDGENRRAVRTVGAMVDVTERQHIDEALRASERGLREAQSIGHIGSWEFEHESNQLSWSDEVYRLFEVEPANFDATYEAFLALVHEEDRDRVLAASLKARAEHTPHQTTYRVPCRDGRTRYLEARSETHYTRDGTALVSRGTVQDVTARVVAEAALRESLQEKETLLREVHHRVKNNLQIIASLLHFQAKKVKDPQDLAAFSDGRARLRAMILVHERLYQSGDLSRIEFGPYLRSLSRDLQSSHNTAGANVTVQVSADTVRLPIQIAVPCGMIVCELLTNVFKYAYPHGRSGSAQVSLTEESSRVRLVVSDDGVGLPATFTTLGATSFGWQLIRNLTVQLGGQLSLDRAAGTRVTLEFNNESGAM